MLNLGFYNTSSTRTHVRFIFSTHAAAGANVAPNSAFENTDIRIYKATDGAAHSATQRSSSNGITMTSPFDSLTGVHEVDIDLTDNTDASFYVAGFYTVVLAPDETVDSQTITGIPLAVFEIGVAKADVTQFGGTAGIFASGIPAVNATQISGDSTAADNAESFFDGTGYAGTNNVIPTVTTLTNLPAITAGWLTATGIAADAITAAKIADGAIDAATFATGAITAASLAADAGTEIATAVWASSLNLSDGGTALASALLVGAFEGLVAVGGTVNDATATTTVFKTTLTEANNYWNDHLVKFTSGALVGQTKPILSYSQTNGTITLDEALTSAPANGVTFRIVATHVHPISQIFGTALTESYSADGAAFTAAQALYEIRQGISEFAISGTTKTTKKIDGTTTAMTHTLNSATAPTSITRAT